MKILWRSIKKLFGFGPTEIVEGWESQYFCKKCGGELSYKRMMCNGGVCVICGAVSDGTIVDCEKKSVRRSYKV